MDTGWVVCPECGRGDVELPVLDGRARGMCPGCYAAIDVAVSRCRGCGDWLSGEHMDSPQLCGECGRGQG